ncbi:MAG: hypothetical protein OXC19_11135 [Bryobacterales bacterium]|nr:hypothetical protein [Bryobacterales bacterium]
MITIDNSLAEHIENWRYPNTEADQQEAINKGYFLLQEDTAHGAIQKQYDASADARQKLWNFRYPQNSPEVMEGSRMLFLCLNRSDAAIGSLVFQERMAEYSVSLVKSPSDGLSRQ